MTVAAIQRAAKPGIPAGYEAAFGQVWHNHTAARLTVAAPELVEMDCNIGVKGKGFEYIFGRGKGLCPSAITACSCWTIPCAPTSGGPPPTTTRLRRTLRVCLLENCRTVCPL